MITSGRSCTNSPIAKVHVLEEARHVSFAKTYISEIWATLATDDREMVRAAAATLVAGVVRLNLDTDVYAALGIDDGLQMVQSNPSYRRTVINGLAKLTGFLTEVGVIDSDHEAEWVTLGLIAS